MAPTDAKDTGAEFEENRGAQKIEVKTRPRVGKPESTGSSTVDAGEAEEDHRTDEPGTPLPKSKSTVLEPDVPTEDLKPKSDENSNEDEGPKTDDGQIVNELAQAAADKKTAEDAAKAPPVADKNAQALIDNKTYFVPVGQVTKRRNTTIFMAVLLLAVAAGAVAYFVLV